MKSRNPSITFKPHQNNAHIVAGNPQAAAILETLFEACGWNVVDCAAVKPKRNRRKRRGD